MPKNNATQPENLEMPLFNAADKLRNNTDAAKHKHVVHGPECGALSPERPLMRNMPQRLPEQSRIPAAPTAVCA